MRSDRLNEDFMRLRGMNLTHGGLDVSPEIELVPLILWVDGLAGCGVYLLLHVPLVHSIAAVATTTAHASRVERVHHAHPASATSVHGAAPHEASAICS
jgi:hypothetical protein